MPLDKKDNLQMSNSLMNLHNGKKQNIFHNTDDLNSYYSLCISSKII